MASSDDLTPVLHFCRYERTKGIENVYRLGRTPLLFLDPGLLQPGHVVWSDREGTPAKLHRVEREWGRDELFGERWRSPRGVRIAPEPARMGPPVPSQGSLLLEEGRYRLWSLALAPKGLGGETGAPEDLAATGHVLRYWESDDGVAWTAPPDERYPVDGKAENIVWADPRIDLHGGCVFRDPDAPPAQRYKAFGMGPCPPEQIRALAAARGRAYDPLCLQTGGGQTMRGATSPDGIHWTPLDEPVGFFISDTLNTVHRDPRTGRYVAYVRMWTRGRRTVGRTETDDFADWPPPRPVLLPGVDEPPTWDYYTNAHTFYPGRDDLHLFFVTVYRRESDTGGIRLAVSLDNETLEFLGREEVLPASDPLGWDRAYITPGHGLVPFGETEVGILHTAFDRPHKWPRTPSWRQETRWALWQRDRLAAVRADGEGEFVLARTVLEAPEIFVNARTWMSGSLRAALLDAEGEPVPGYGFDACAPIVGDHAAAPLRWNGRPVPPETVGRPMYLHFRLAQARLYAVHAGDPA